MQNVVINRNILHVNTIKWKNDRFLNQKSLSISKITDNDVFKWPKIAKTRKNDQESVITFEMNLQGGFLWTSTTGSAVPFIFPFPTPWVMQRWRGHSPSFF